MREKQKGYKEDVLMAKAVNLGKVVGATVLYPKLSSNGKPGFFGTGTVMLKCCDASYKFQVGINVTAIDNERHPLDETTRQAILACQPMLAETILKGKIAEPREFSTGSVGYHYGDKVTLEIDGTPVVF